MSYQQNIYQERTVTTAPLSGAPITGNFAGGPPVEVTGEVWSNRANAGDIVIERCDYCPQEDTEEKGMLENIKEKAIDIKDKITGNTPEKKAEKYAKKCQKCLKKEHKHEKEAEKYAEKAAEKSQKYAGKAAKELDKKTELEEKAACYHAKAVENSEKVRECRDSKIDAQADKMHIAACRIQDAH